MIHNKVNERLIMLKKIVFLPLLVAGCASSTDKIGTAYVSPLTYSDYNCKQVGAEMARIGRRASELTHNINKNASGDSVAMGVGLVLFWPSLFFIDGDSPEAQEYARLKGEYNAAEQASIQKECGFNEPNPFAEAERKRREAQEKERQGYCPPSRRGRC